MSFNVSFTLPELLSIEDDEGLLLPECPVTGILLWPLIRLPFFRTIMSDYLYQYPLFRSSHIGSLTVSAFGTLAKSYVHNLRYADKFTGEICIMATAVGAAPCHGRWFNRLSDHFALSLPDQSLVIEGQYRWRWAYPRSFPKVLWHAPIQAQGVLTGHVMLRERHIKSASDLVQLARGRAKALLGLDVGDDQAKYLTYRLARSAAALPWQYRAYKKMLRRAGAKLLLKEEGCYGHSAAVIAAARDLDMVTAEYQHGLVSAGHDAYNFAPAACNSPSYRRLLPDYFLGYGQWWLDQINLPVKKLVVGNPHRTEQIVQMRKEIGRDSAVVLIFGDGVQTDKYIDLAMRLAQSLQGKYMVILRPHPLERKELLSRFLDGRVGAAYIDKNHDLYQSLGSASVVVGEITTALFEAIGIVDRIFVWETPISKFSLPSHPFTEFGSMDQLQLMIRDGSSGVMSDEDAEAIWASDWRSNYLDFVKQNGISISTKGFAA